MVMDEISENLPDYLKISIEHERKLIRLREAQIDGYVQRIRLMSAGMDYYKSLQKVPPRKASIYFDKCLYVKLRDKCHGNSKKQDRKKIRS